MNERFQETDERLRFLGRRLTSPRLYLTVSLHTRGMMLLLSLKVTMMLHSCAILAQDLICLVR